MKVYDKALSSPLSLKDTEEMCEYIDAAHSVATLMKNIDTNENVDPDHIATLGELLTGLLSHPMEASGQILSEKRDAGGAA